MPTPESIIQITAVVMGNTATSVQAGRRVCAPKLATSASVRMNGE